MKLGWYIARLRNMGPAEIGHRLVEMWRRRAGRRWTGGWADWAATAPRPLAAFGDRVRAADPRQREIVARAAEATLAGRFTALGRDWPQRSPGNLFPPELWRLDPVTGALWPGPDTYCFEVDFRHDGRRGDIKYVWEINRLQFLVPLATRHALTGDPVALAAIVAAIESWAEANPPFRGVAWASGIEVALRAISLLLVQSIAGTHLPPTVGARIGAIVAASRHWLEQFPSLHSSANNHRIAELAGLHLIALAQGGDDRRWGEALAAEILLQILPDGAGAEQTPTYAAFSAELALLCLAAGAAAGRDLSAKMADRLARFAEFVAWLGGEPPLAFGDDDEGRALTDGSAEHDYPRSVATAIAARLGRPGPAPAETDLRALLLGGSPAPLPSPAGLRTFRDGGLSVWHGHMANRSARLSFDHGPLGYLSIAAHGHADALAVTLALDGQPVLVDPGTYLYGSGGPWRRWLRSTAAHNTLNIDGADQSQMAGAFNWLKHARTSLVTSQATAAGCVLEATHDGYRSRFGVVHHRRVVVDRDAVAITDRLTGGPREAELVYQLPPEIEAEVAGTEVVLRTPAGDGLCVLLLPPGDISLRRGDGTPGQGGHVSPAFGQLVPAVRIAWRGAVGPEGVVTRITALPRSLDTPPAQT